MDAGSLAFFVAASLLLISTPGQDMILVMSRSVAQGARAGVATAGGVSVGLLGHTLLATIGLGAVLTASETLFTVMRLLGAVYLMYLGVKTWRSPPTVIDGADGPQRSVRRMFIEGAVSNLANPKIAVFYFAFLPQFVAADASNAALQLFLLGALFAVLTFIVKCPIGLVAGRLSHWLRVRPGVQIAMNRVSGDVLVSLGVKLALDQSPVVSADA
ncbi:MAG: LysE family translocator [Pseudomonadota bacterium]